MAIANTSHGNTKTSSTAATTSGAITTTAAIGETIVVAVGTVNTTSNAPTDSASNTYVQLGAITTNTERITFWGCLSNKGASPSVTCTFGSSRYGIAIATYTGVKGFNQNNTTTHTGGTTPATATLPNALNTGSWAIAAFVEKGTAAWSASTGNLRNNIAGAGTTTPGAAIVDNTTTTCAAATSATAWAGTIIELTSFFIQSITAVGAAINADVAKQSQIPLSAASSSFSGGIAKQIQIAFAAVSSALSAALTETFQAGGTLFHQSVTAVSSAFNGDLAKQTLAFLTATSTALKGAVTKQTLFSLAARAAAIDGSVAKQIGKLFSATATHLSAAVIKKTSVLLAAMSSAFSATENSTGLLFEAVGGATSSAFSGSLSAAKSALQIIGSWLGMGVKRAHRRRGR